MDRRRYVVEIEEEISACTERDPQMTQLEAADQQSSLLEIHTEGNLSHAPSQVAHLHCLKPEAGPRRGTWRHQVRDLRAWPFPLALFQGLRAVLVSPCEPITQTLEDGRLDSVSRNSLVPGWKGCVTSLVTIRV